MKVWFSHSWILLLGMICTLLPVSAGLAQAPLMEMGDVVVFPGQSGVQVELSLSSDQPVSGIQMGISADPDRIIFQQIDLTGGVLAGLPVEFLETDIDIEEGEATLLVIIDGAAPFDQSLPPATAAMVGNLVLDASSWLVPSNVEPINFTDGVGEPPLDNLVLIEGVAVTPDLESGSLSVISQNVLHAQSTSGIAAAGEINHEISLRGYNTDDLQGFSSAMSFDPTVLSCSYASVDDTITSVAGAEFVEEIINNDEGFVVLGVLMDILPPYAGQVIPATGIEMEFARFYFDVSSELTSSSDTQIRFEQDLGVPPISNVFVIGNQSVPPLTIDLTIPIQAEGVFLRGDADSNLRLDLADAIINLVYMSNACPTCPIPTCPKALDVNDDGRIDIGDGILLLNFLYLDGPEPPPPYPEAGIDPTPDSLECVT
ncbi:MAG: hypothetical protein VX764_04260 [Planctomycetota bacterium]|nr:hypothetical protein [Planctomycetota bacterium]